MRRQYRTLSKFFWDIYYRIRWDQVVASPSYGVRRNLGEFSAMNLNIGFDCAADGNNFKSDVFSLPVTVSPNDQGWNRDIGFHEVIIATVEIALSYP